MIIDGQEAMRPADYADSYQPGGYLPCAGGTTDANGLVSMTVLVRAPSLPLAQRPISFAVTARSDGLAATFNLRTSGAIMAGVSSGPFS